MAKIIISIDGNIPSKFAHSFNVMKMYQGFLDNGHSVKLVTLLSFPILKNILILSPISKHYGISKYIKVKYIPIFHKDSLKKTISVKGFNEKAAKYIKSQKPDFVYCRSYLTPVECIKKNVNVVVETHTTNISNNVDLKKLFELSNSKYFKGIVTINNQLKKLYIESGVSEKKIIVLEDGVDLSLFDISDNKSYWRKKLKLPKNKKILMYLGGLFKEKGIKSILKTHKLLISNKNNICTIFIGGKDKDIQIWKNYCNENNISNVIFLGFKPNSDLPKYMKAADVLMMPYDTEINFKVMDINTTSPLKLFEYMGSKRPILSSNIPVINKIVTHKYSAMLAEENNIESQAKMVNILLNDNQISEKISIQAFKDVKEYEWKRRCEKIFDRFF